MRAQKDKTSATVAAPAVAAATSAGAEQATLSNDLATSAKKRVDRGAKSANEKRKATPAVSQMARSENDQTPVVNSIVPARATSSNAVARSTSASA